MNPVEYALQQLRQSIDRLANDYATAEKLTEVAKDGAKIRALVGAGDVICDALEVRFGSCPAVEDWKAAVAALANKQI